MFSTVIQVWSSAPKSHLLNGTNQVYLLMCQEKAGSVCTPCSPAFLRLFLPA